MPLDLPLPKREHKAAWRVKIWDKEALEPPHVTILHKGNVVGRYDLRERRFLVPPPCSWKGVPDAVKDAIESNYELLCRSWDSMHPSNPIRGGGD